MSQPAASPQAYEYDVFISYSRKDKAWVRGELATRLRQAGLKTCIDVEDFRAGAPTLKEIERAVTISRKTLLIITPNYIASEWTEFERYLLQTTDPTNKDCRILPLRYKACELPRSVRYLSYIDFTEPTEIGLAWRQLFRAFSINLTTTQAEAKQPRQWQLVHPYAMPPHFTGRAAERQMLSQWLNEDTQHSLMVLRALGGFGKSALTWHWLLNDVDKRRWPRVMWWSFYEAQAGFDNFVATALTYLMGRKPTELKPQERVDALLNCLRQPGTVLVLDGYERELRAYSNMGAAYQGDGKATVANEGRDCVNPDAEDFFRKLCSLPNMQSKVLMSTRLRPRPVEVTGGMLLSGCEEKELTQMQPADAVVFFQALGIRGNRNEITQACNTYGFHPLSLRLLAGLVVKDFYNPGDIQAAQALDITGNLVQRQHHVLEQSYSNLSQLERQLLHQLACSRYPVSIFIIEKIFQEETHTEDIDQTLRETLTSLLSRGLVQRDDSDRPYYDLHPIVRRYAYDRMTDKARSNTHGKLRDYFTAIPITEKINTLNDLAPAIEQYHHTVNAGQYNEAHRLFYTRLHTAIYYQLGNYQLHIKLLDILFTNGKTYRPKLSNVVAEAWTLGALGSSYCLCGQPKKAISLFRQQVDLRERISERKQLAIALCNLAIGQTIIGNLKAADVNFKRSVDFCQSIDNKFWQAVGYIELGRVHTYCGHWAQATTEIIQALTIFETNNNIQWKSVTWANRTLQALLEIRSRKNPLIVQETINAALLAGKKAVKFAKETARIKFPYARDYVRAHWLLGAAHRFQSNLPDSEHHLNTALHRCRTINLIELEADILLDIVRLRRDQGQAAEANRLAQEALTIANRSGYVLQGADVNLFLAEQAVAEGDEAKAQAYASTARELATCDGGEYTYKVAYEEAGALLAKLGVSEG